MSPNLVQEIAVAQPMEDKPGRAGSSHRSAAVGKRDALRGILVVADENGDTILGKGFDTVIACRVRLIADDKVEGDSSLNIGLLSLSGRCHQEHSQRKKKE